MGSSQTKSMDLTHSNSSSAVSNSLPINMENISYDGLNLNGYVLSSEILSHIFSFVPDKDLICKCQLVCKIWKQIIDEHSVWKMKCDRGHLIYPHALQNIPRHFYRIVCLKNPYERNLIKNPFGKEKLKHWQHIDDGDGWVVEDPPNGADPLSTVDELKNVTSCFATSYTNQMRNRDGCRKTQLVNLVKEGVHPEILDEMQPVISVSDWYAARFDCASRYGLIVTLLDKSEKEIKRFEYGPIDEVQWVGRAWHKVEHQFRNYGPGVRYVRFYHYGHDLQFWAGNYGSKMTASSVRLIVND